MCGAGGCGAVRCGAGAGAGAGADADAGRGGKSAPTFADRFVDATANPAKTLNGKAASEIL